MIGGIKPGARDEYYNITDNFLLCTFSAGEIIICALRPGVVNGVAKDLTDFRK